MVGEGSSKGLDDNPIGPFVHASHLIFTARLYLAMFLD